MIRWRARLCVVLACWMGATLSLAQDRADPHCERGRGSARKGNPARKTARAKRKKAEISQPKDSGPALDDDAPSKRRSRRAQRKTGRKAREAAPAPAPPVERDSDLFERPTPPVSEPEPDVPSTPMPDETSSSDSSEAPPEDEPEECTPSPDNPCTPPLKATLILNAGVTMRRISVPTLAGPAQLDTGLVPALGLQLGAHWRGPDLFYEIAIAYQSSLRADATQPASDELKPPLFTGIHSHHLDAGGSAGLVLGSGPASATLGLFVGYGVRALGSVVELRVPRFTLHGPVARLELQLPLGTPSVVVRLAPEAQLILSATQDLTDMSAIAVPIFAFGGEASVRVMLTSRFILQLAFRESHAAVSSRYGASFEDVERFVLFGVVLSYL